MTSEQQEIISGMAHIITHLNVMINKLATELMILQDSLRQTESNDRSSALIKLPREI